MENAKESRSTGPGGLSARDIFASEASIHRLLDRVDSAEAKTPSPTGWQSSLVKLMVAANLTLVTILVVYLAFTHGQVQVVEMPPQPLVQTSARNDAPQMPVEPTVPVKEAVGSDDIAVGVRSAQQLYLNGNYSRALEGYRALTNGLSGGQYEARLLTAYLQFKMGLCYLRLNNQMEAMTLLNAAISGPSPTVAALATYNSAIIEIRAERFAVARTRLYNCLGLLGALPEGLPELLERECTFLLAQATVGRYLQVLDQKADLPGDLWSRPSLDDPAADMSYEDLISFVSSGKDLFPSATLVRQSQQLSDNAPSRWTIAAKNTGVFEVLSSLGARASFSMKWDTSDADKLRRVSLRLIDKSPDSAAEIVAGCAGLMASVRSGVPTIINPESIMSREQQRKLYSAEALLLLNRFILLYTKDDSVASAYFAMGVVHEYTGAAAAAIADYKLLTGRHASSHLVPYALWSSSRMKVSLRDADGAKEDLQQLIELNPDHAIYAKASFRLGELLMTDGMYREANRLFRKVYTMSPSGEYQTCAALAAARCSYELKDDPGAAEWFSTYIQVETNTEAPQLYEAAMSLGMSLRRMGKLPQSVEALKFAMARELSTEQKTRAAIELARTEMAGQCYIKALAALQNLPVTPNLTDDEMEVLLLTCQINHEIGMPERAAMALQNAIDRAYSKERAASLAIPLARAFVEMGKDRDAADVLTKMLASIRASDTANQICCELAEINLRLGHNSEAISLCKGLIAARPSDELIEQAWSIMGRAYTNLKQYEMAAMAFAGRASADGGEGI